MKFVFVFILLFNTALMAQELPPTTQEQLEDLANATEDEQEEDDNLLQQLDYFRAHPIALNQAGAEDLQQVRILSDLQIASFLRYRKLMGNLVSIYELQAIPTWDMATIAKILPFVVIDNPVPVKEALGARLKGGEQTLLLRGSRVLEKSKGYNATLPTHYLGDRNRLMMRYRYQYKNLLYFGLTADKDAGEQFFKGAQRHGFDFYSVHFFARNIGVIKSVAVGDYAVNLGQGLIQWQSLGFGKSSEVMGIKRQGPVLTPYRSAGEFYFNRGAAVTLQKGNFKTTVFVSRKKISGNLANDTTDRFTSLLMSGYYRTPAEISDRNKISLSSAGGNIGFQSNQLKLAFNAVAHQFDRPLQKRDEPYNYYAIAGRKFFNSSVDYSYTYRNVHVFGEAAVDKKFHRAIVSGALLSVDPRVDFSIFYRSIQKEYQTLFGNAFTENTNPVNEKGLFMGVKLRPSAPWQVYAYGDFFRFPWLRYRVNAPSSGYDYLAQVSYQPDKGFSLYVRYKNKNKPIDSSSGAAIYFPVDEVKRSLRVHLSQQLSRVFSLSSRVEMMWYDRDEKNTEQGFLGYVQGNYKAQKFSANLRVQYFETNSYNSRIYAYESDVLYSFSIPAFYDKGFRYYFNVHVDLNRKTECWVRLSQTAYTDRTSVGSGLDSIDGNSKTELKLQLRYRF